MTPRALRLLRRASDLNDPFAQHILGQHLIETEETYSGRFEGARLMIAATQQGIDEALLPAAEILLQRPTRNVRSVLRPILMQAWEEGRTDVVPHIAKIRKASNSNDALRWHLKSAALGYTDWFDEVASMKLTETTIASDWELAAWEALKAFRQDANTDVSIYFTKLDDWQWLQALALIETVMEFVPLEKSPAFHLHELDDIEDRIHRLHEISQDRLQNLSESYTLLSTGAVETSPQSLLEDLHADSWPIKNPELNIQFVTHLFNQGHTPAWQRAYQKLIDQGHDERAQQLLAFGVGRQVPHALWVWASNAISDTTSPTSDTRINDLLAIAATEVGEAESALILRLESNTGLDAKSEQQRPYIARLAEQGNLDAQAALAVWVRNTEYASNTLITPEQSDTYLKAAADRGHAEAAFLLSIDLRSKVGEGEYIFTEEALHYLKIAAENGHADAMFLMGSIHINMDRMERDLEQAYRWIRSAAEAGHRTARYFFTDFREGEMAGARRSLFNSFYRATVLEEPEAMVEIGDYYLWNEESPSIEEGLRWLERAAEYQYFPAFHAVAVLYMRGTRVERDPIRAFRWLEAAAELGDSESSFILANQYLAGTHLPRDADRAQRHLLRAAGQGHLQAIEMIRYSDQFRGVVQESGSPSQLEQLEGVVDLRAFYPVKPVVVVRGRPHEIINVSRLRPIVDLGNRNLRLRDDVRQHLKPASGYHHVAITELKLTYETPYWRDGENFVITGGDPRLIGEIHVDQDIANVLMLVINENKAHEPKFHWFRLGDLNKGRANRISEYLPEIIWDRNDLSIFFFSNGVELLSPLRKQAIYRNRPIDRRFETAKMEEQRKVQATDTRSARLWSAADSRIVSEKLESGTEIEFMLSINSLGLVEGIEMISDGFDEIEDSVIHSLLQLQFYPALENGIPISSRKPRTLTVF